MPSRMSLQHRQCDPVALQIIWRAIDMIRGQRQIANIVRLTKMIQRQTKKKQKVIMTDILKAIRDKVVVETLTLGCKGSKAGLEQEGYWIPEVSEVMKARGTHDCYCFNCHKPGEIIRCESCGKVFHENCASLSESFSKEKMAMFSCQYCNCMKTVDSLSSKKREDLNKCLYFIAKRAITAAPQLVSQPNPENYRNFEYFIWEHLTLKEIADACSRQVYTSAADFMRQVNILNHNCVILYGEDEGLALQARRMIETCKHELKEFNLCPNCYLLSSTKPSRNWFCQPCDPTHKVVWAKQKGFEYWPAKVMQSVGDTYDVRFFGGHHERAWITPNWARNIAVSPTELGIKKTKGWLKACDEMKLYIAETEKMFGHEAAKDIVKFDIKNTTDEVDNKKEQCISSEVNSLVKRGRKRKIEMQHLASAKSKKINNDKSVESTSANKSSGGPNCIKPETTKRNIADYLIEQNSKQVKTYGEKAKLSTECARTWPYAKECIMLDRCDTKSGAQSSSRVKKCDCERIYSRRLFLYQSRVRRLRAKERRDNLTISAHYVHNYLNKYMSNYKAMKAENERLKKENEELKATIDQFRPKTSKM